MSWRDMSAGPLLHLWNSQAEALSEALFMASSPCEIFCTGQQPRPSGVHTYLA